MKKAKIMLAAIALVGVVGGAFAFKAEKFGGTLYCSAVAHTTKYYPTVYAITETVTAPILDCTTTTTTSIGTATYRVLPNE